MSRRSGQSGSIQKDGKWYVVRYWKDVAGQEKRVRVREKICPISGPGKLSASERERKAKEIIAASGVDTQEYFDKVVKERAPGVTFREQAALWLDKMRNRKRKPVAPSTLENWAKALGKWVNPNIGDMPLEAVNNLTMKNFVATMVKGGLAPKTIDNYTQTVKMVMASALNEQGEELYPRKWNSDFIDAPVVNKQRRPSFTGDVVTAILAATKKERDVVLFALCASAGLRIGEVLGLDIKNISQDASTIKVVQKAWFYELHDFLKTSNAIREVDLHPLMASRLREFIGQKQSGLLFASRHGKPLDQSSILRRKLHPVLAKIGQPKCGFHAFRRFRNTYLRNYTATPPGIYKYWMGHASADTDAMGAALTGETMSDRYDRVEHERALRKEWAERAGLGFELPPKRSKSRVLGLNGPKRTEIPSRRLVVTACA
jgi:integrase